MTKKTKIFRMLLVGFMFIAGLFYIYMAYLTDESAFLWGTFCVWGLAVVGEFQMKRKAEETHLPTEWQVAMERYMPEGGK